MLKRGEPEGSLSFIERAKCHESEQAESCVVLRFVREQKEPFYQNTSTYLTVEPTTLKLYSLVAGNSLKFSGREGRVEHSVEFSYRRYGNETAEAPVPNISREYKKIFDFDIGREANFKDLYAIFRPRVKSLNIDHQFCKLKTAKLDRHCENIQVFYTDKVQMKQLARLEDLADTTELSRKQKNMLDSLSGIMERRPFFLAVLNLKDRTSLNMQSNDQMQRLASDIIDELKVSPVTSKRHKLYSKKVIAALNDATDSSWLKAYKDVTR